MSNIQLKYIGKGSFLRNVPARDLTKEEVDQHGGAAYLIGTGLYAYAPSEDIGEDTIIAEEAPEVSQPSHSKKKDKEK